MYSIERWGWGTKKPKHAQKITFKRPFLPVNPSSFVFVRDAACSGKLLLCCVCTHTYISLLQVWHSPLKQQLSPKSAVLCYTSVSIPLFSDWSVEIHFLWLFMRTINTRLSGSALFPSPFSEIDLIYPHILVTISWMRTASLLYDASETTLSDVTKLVKCISPTLMRNRERRSRCLY